MTNELLGIRNSLSTEKWNQVIAQERAQTRLAIKKW